MKILLFLLIYDEHLLSFFLLEFCVQQKHIENELSLDFFSNQISIFLI